MLEILAPPLANALGITLLVHAWQTPAPEPAALVIGGWMFVFVAVGLWLRCAGLPFGIAYFVLYSALAAWISALVMFAPPRYPTEHSSNLGS